MKVLSSVRGFMKRPGPSLPPQLHKRSNALCHVFLLRGTECTMVLYKIHEIEHMECYPVRCATCVTFEMEQSRTRSTAVKSPVRRRRARRLHYYCKLWPLTTETKIAETNETIRFLRIERQLNEPFSRADQRTFVVRPSKSYSSPMRHPCRRMIHRSAYFACGLLLCFGLLREINNSQETNIVEIQATNDIASNDAGGDEQDSIHQLNEQIAKIKGINGTHAFNQGGYEGTIEIQQIHATSFKPSSTNTIRFIEPNSIYFEFKDVEAVIESKFHVKASLFSVSGTVRADLKQMTVALKTNMQVAPDNQAKVVVNSCNTAIGKTHFSVDASGAFGTIAKSFEGMISEQARIMMPGFLCNIFTIAIEDRESQLFDRLLMKKPKNSSKNGLFFDFQQALQSCPAKICDTLRRRYSSVYYSIKSKGF